MRLIHFFWLSLMLLCLVPYAMHQAHLKLWPQVVLMLLGVLTLLAMSQKQKVSARVFFAIICFVLLWCGAHSLFDVLFEFLYPKHGWMKVDGQWRYKVLDGLDVFAMIAAGALSLLLSVKYTRSSARNKFVEYIAASLFTCTTVVVWFLCEVLWNKRTIYRSIFQ